MAFGQRFAECVEHVFHFYQRTYFQQSSQDNHIESLGCFHFGGCVHGVDTIDRDVLARRRRADAVSVVNQCPARLNALLELFQRRLVQVREYKETVRRTLYYGLCEGELAPPRGVEGED